MGIQEGKEREKGTEEILETKMTENFPKLVSENKPPKLRKHQTRYVPKKPTNTHIQTSENQSQRRKKAIGKNILPLENDKNCVQFLIN